MKREDAKRLPAGSPEHYSAFVGPPDQYDFMGATQFRLVCALGLREHHHLLDFGCGSLRAGRLLMMYLERGRYYGIEPERWLIDNAIQNELGGDQLVNLKQPRFDSNADFRSDVFGVPFDFIVAQSIFSHTGPELTLKALRGFAAVLKSDGLVLATFVPPTRLPETGAEGWHYPECVTYSQETVAAFAQQAGLAHKRIPWFHPRQDWFVFAHDAAQLPSDADAEQHLSGRVLRDQSLQRREV